MTAFFWRGSMEKQHKLLFKIVIVLLIASENLLEIYVIFCLPDMKLQRT